MSNEPPPCPFCGSQPELIAEESLVDTRCPGWCPVSGEAYSPTAWNRRTASAWISVEDALPIDGRDVLAWYGTPYISFHLTYSGYFGWAGDAMVTHWQPLPEPPVKPPSGGEPERA